MRKIFIPLLLQALVMVSPAVALAQYNSTAGGSYNSSAGGYTVDNPLAVTSFCGLLQKILDAVVALGIPVAVLFLVIVGFQFILARGNPGDLAKARKNFLNTIIGIAIFIGAWAIVQVIISTMAQFGVSLAACRV